MDLEVTMAYFKVYYESFPTDTERKHKSVNQEAGLYSKKQSWDTYEYEAQMFITLQHSVPIHGTFFNPM